jgi:uncharacterized membrane protein
MLAQSWNLTSDPLWPWSLPGVGLLLLATVGLLLAGLTVWTYLGVPQASSRRISALLGLRLLALVLTMFVLLRTSLASRSDDRLPSVLLLALDGSESMTIKDEFGNQTRWQALLAALRQAEPTLRDLQERQNVTVALHRFAEDVTDFDPQGKADGKRTDFGQMLFTLYQRYDKERNLRGLLILSDGADNGTRFEPLSLAMRWRSLPCPIYTFSLGQESTTSEQNDIAFTHISTDPAPVPVKAKLAVHVGIDAPGFVKPIVRMRLLFDDREVPFKVEDSADSLRPQLSRPRGNQVTLTADAPDKPGEVKVTVKVDPLPGEVNPANNEISTYITVVKEGVSILFVDKARFPEPQRICDALSPDPRIRLYVDWRRTDAPAAGDLFEFHKKHYDVIILGDVTAKRLAAGSPRALAEIEQLVSKGTGLLLMGGYETFGAGDWRNTPLERLSPVEFNTVGQIEEPVSMQPTEDGLRHSAGFVLRLADTEADSKQLWKKLPKLEGMTRLGQPKRAAVVLATSEKGLPMLVAQPYGEGRVLAMAADTTWQWQRLGQPDSNEGVTAHARFWRQLAIWLARQEEADANVWIRMPDNRRIPAGGKLDFSVGLRGKGGVDLKDANFTVTVEGPPKSSTLTPRTREGAAVHYNFWMTEQPGEYRIVARGSGKDIDGKEVSGEKSARFLVYRDEAEMLRQAADHDFLTRLASAGGGKRYRAEELPRVLKELQGQPLPRHRPRVERWPDWKKEPPPDSSVRDQMAALSSSGVMVTFSLFVAVLCLEWFLRRYWGLV